ncbi:MAG: MFS transporter [Alphaproteobacteria bacterium]|nr:MFS transporter [Alphaproteobacteria bacterium]
MTTTQSAPLTANAKNIFNATVIITALGYMVDVYDILIFSALRTPSLIDLGLTGDAVTKTGMFIINMQMTGLIIGGLIFGMLGDKIGRKKCLLGSILLYSLATLGCAVVQTVDQYAALRFVAGLGLAGEVGIGVALITENMKKEHRGLGVAVFTFIGIGGAVIAGVAAELLPWRTCYLIGGIAGLLLLATRSILRESGMFSKAHEDNVKRGDFLQFIKQPKLGLRYLYCVLIGVPIYFVIAIPWTLSPELAKAMNVPFPVKASIALAIGYSFTMIGDLLAGILSHIFKSRRIIITGFIIFGGFVIGLFMQMRNLSVFEYYMFCALLGVAIGYWVNMITVAAEQFGTNLRATAATSIPNFVRATTIPMYAMLGWLKPSMGILSATSVIATIAIVLSLVAVSQLRETFHEDLDYYS